MRTIMDDGLYVSIEWSGMEYSWDMVIEDLYVVEFLFRLLSSWFSSVWFFFYLFYEFYYRRRMNDNVVNIYW